MADLASDLVAVLQLGPDLVVPPDLVAQLPQEEDQATLRDEKKSTSSKLSESISITLFSIGTTLDCFEGLPGVFFPFGFLEESVTLLVCADLDLGLPTLGFPSGTYGVWCADFVLVLPTLDVQVEGMSAI